jgi:hypothetical protein
MTRHAISKESRTWLGWPSIQRDSEALRLRIVRARRAEHLRATWHSPILNRKRAA